MEENTSKVFREPANAPLRQQPAAGSPLFVINLCASMAPMEITGKTLPGFETYRLYTVARVEDGRTRYRLRMGFFVTQQAAEEVVSMLRKQYATAFAACLSDEDRRFARGYVPEPDTSSTARERMRPAVAVVPQPPPVKQATPQTTVRASTPSPVPAKAAPAVQARGTVNVPAAPIARTASPAAPIVRTAMPAIAQRPAPARPAVNAPQARSVDSSSSGVFERSWEPESRAPASPSPKAGASGSFKVPAGSFSSDATGSFKNSATGKFKMPAGSVNPDATGSFKNGATGKFKMPAGSVSPDATGSFKNGATGKLKVGTGTFKALDQNAIDEIELSWDQSGLKLPPSPPVAAQSSAARPAAPKAPAPAARQVAAPAVAPKVPPMLKAEPPVQARPAAKAQAPVVKAQQVPAAKAPVKAAAPEAKRPPVTVKPSAQARLELEAAPVAHKQAAPAAPNNQPFHVGKGVNIPQVSLSLQQEPPARQAQPAAKQTDETSTRLPKLAPAIVPANKMGVPSKPLQPASAAATAQLPPNLAGLPDLDSTQTIRALTSEEMSDANQEKWWAIQLAVSEQPLNLDAMPHLDIFEAYRLYSVASAGGGKIVHSLRLGFFREAVSAEAVSGYLKTFFPTQSILRISTAEQARFKDTPAPKSSAAPKPESKVIDLNDARDRAKPVPPTVTMEVGKADRSPSGAYKVGAAPAAKNNGSSGMYKALNPGAAKPAQVPVVRQPAARQPLAPRRAAAPASQSGKYRAQPRVSLQDQLLDEAREVQLSESGMRRMSKSDSLLSRLVDKLKK